MRQVAQDDVEDVGCLYSSVVLIETWRDVRWDSDPTSLFRRGVSEGSTPGNRRISSFSLLIVSPELVIEACLG